MLHTALQHKSQSEIPRPWIFELESKMFGKKNQKHLHKMNIKKLSWKREGQEVKPTVDGSR